MQLVGQKRKLFGKKTKYLKYEKKLPAVIFGKGLDSISITIDFIDFVKIYDAAGETSVVDIVVDKDKYPTLIKELQVHHITSEPIHVGFYKVDLKEKISANIPVEVINEEENPLVKNGEALVLVLMNEVEVEALPTDLPDKFVLDALKLENMDSIITIADLDYDKEKVEIVESEPEEIVVKLDHAQMLEEEEEPEEVDEAEAMADIEASEEKELSDEVPSAEASEEEGKESKKE